MPEITPAYIMLLTVGLLATGCQIGFSLSTSRLRLILFSLAASFGFLIQYLMLGQWIGFWSGVVGTTYTALLAVAYRIRVFQKAPFMVAAALGYVGVFLALTDWAHFVAFQAIPLVAGIAVLVALRSQNLILTKGVFIAAGVLWFTYEIFNGMYTQLIGEGFELVGNVITLAVLLRASSASRAALEAVVTRPLPILDSVDTELLAVLRVGEAELEAEAMEQPSYPPTEPLEVVRG